MGESNFESFSLDNTNINLSIEIVKRRILHYLKEARSVVSEWDSTNNQKEASTDES